jgi:hypothetical protein
MTQVLNDIPFSIYPYFAILGRDPVKLTFMEESLWSLFILQRQDSSAMLLSAKLQRGMNCFWLRQNGPPRMICPGMQHTIVWR